MAALVLLTDFGLADPYVAAVRGVLLARAGGAPVVDLSHEVAPGDIEGAAFLLAASAPWFPPQTVFLAVVDPGVGSDRRILAARRRGHFFVAPDNGLLTGVLSHAEARTVERPDLYLAGPGATFHGRDRLAPVAAYLAGGGLFASLGPRVADPRRLAIPAPRRRGSRLVGRIAHVDRFGNLLTDVPTAWLASGAPPPPFVAAVGTHQTRRWATHYAALPAGEPALLAGSLGTLELALAGESLARAWQVGRGERVRIALDRRPAGTPAPPRRRNARPGDGVDC